MYFSNLPCFLPAFLSFAFAGIYGQVIETNTEEVVRHEPTISNDQIQQHYGYFGLQPPMPSVIVDLDVLKGHNQNHRRTYLRNLEKRMNPKAQDHAQQGARSKSPDLGELKESAEKYHKEHLAKEQQWWKSFWDDFNIAEYEIDHDRRNHISVDQKTKEARLKKVNDAVKRLFEIGVAAGKALEGEENAAEALKKHGISRPMSSCEQDIKGIKTRYTRAWKTHSKDLQIAPPKIHGPGALL